MGGRTKRLWEVGLNVFGWSLDFFTNTKEKERLYMSGCNRQLFWGTLFWWRSWTDNNWRTPSNSGTTAVAERASDPKKAMPASQEWTTVSHKQRSGPNQRQTATLGGGVSSFRYSGTNMHAVLQHAIDNAGAIAHGASLRLRGAGDPARTDLRSITESFFEIEGLKPRGGARPNSGPKLKKDKQQAVSRISAQLLANQAWCEILRQAVHSTEDAWRQ